MRNVKYMAEKCLSRSPFSYKESSRSYSFVSPYICEILSHKPYHLCIAQLLNFGGRQWGINYYLGHRTT